MEAEQLAAEVHAELVPVPVTGHVHARISHRVETKGQAADYGAYFTVVFTGTEAAQLLLPYDEHRFKAYVTCTGTGPVWVGSEAQCKAVFLGNTKGGGFQLATGITLAVEHRQQLWVVPDGTHGATVSVAVYRWEP